MRADANKPQRRCIDLALEVAAELGGTLNLPHSARTTAFSVMTVLLGPQCGAILIQVARVPLEEALADSALIRENHWMPDFMGMPGGGKREFILAITRRAMAVRKT